MLRFGIKMSLLSSYVRRLCRVPLNADIRANYAIQSVKPHVPLIKFRKGAPVTGAHSITPGLPPYSGVSGPSSQPRGTIEDYQLPLKYRRSPIDDKEIEYINRGGPE